MKINSAKSEALNLTLPPNSLSRACTSCSFKWETLAITYLGIRLTGNLTDTYYANFQPLLNYIQQDLKEWTTRPFSWFGRAYSKWLYCPESYTTSIEMRNKGATLSAVCGIKFNKFSKGSTHKGTRYPSMCGKNLPDILEGWTNLDAGWRWSPMDGLRRWMPTLPVVGAHVDNQGDEVTSGTGNQ